MKKKNTKQTHLIGTNYKDFTIDYSVRGLEKKTIIYLVFNRRLPHRCNIITIVNYFTRT